MGTIVEFRTTPSSHFQSEQISKLISKYENLISTKIYCGKINSEMVTVITPQ